MYIKQYFLPLVFIAITVSLHSQDRLSGKTFSTRSEVIARSGMVATSHPIATQIAIEILKKGGSAVDAAIAANAFIGFADPGMNGIGGDLFAIVWDAKTKKLYGLNASGRSPTNMSLAYLLAKEKEGISYIRGPLSVTVPGCVDGWFELHKKFGKLTVPEILKPAINYAIEGIPITQETADNMQMDEPMIKKADIPNFKKQYFINGSFPKKGDIYKNPNLAHTLEIISKEGRDGFYKGEVAQQIQDHLKSVGGFITTEDLANHKSEWVEPISTNYRGYDVWEMPPNGQGMGALQILNILEGFDFSKITFGSKEHIHLFTEAKKIAYEDMAAYYGDPSFGNIPIEKLLSKEYAAERRKLINPDNAGIYNPGLSSGSHTIYLTVADKEGNMVSFIQSNSALFGSREVPGDLGFVLQNRGAGFILKEDHINTYAPGKRPFHTIIPAFVTKDGNPFLSFGVMGGDMQTQGHVQIIMDLLDFGMSLQEAGDAPRIYHNGTISYKGHVNDVGTTYLESGFSYETIRGLIKAGHKISYGIGIYGGFQAIMKKDGIYYGASDPRKDGQAAGY
jgi:gamma-glutamyltranspeptidase / glutathione hydrolase